MHIYYLQINLQSAINFAESFKCQLIDLFIYSKIGNIKIFANLCKCLLKSLVSKLFYLFIIKISILPIKISILPIKKDRIIYIYGFALLPWICIFPKSILRRKPDIYIWEFLRKSMEPIVGNSIIGSVVPCFWLTEPLHKYIISLLCPCVWDPRSKQSALCNNIFRSIIKNGFRQMNPGGLKEENLPSVFIDWCYSITTKFTK